MDGFNLVSIVCKKVNHLKKKKKRILTRVWHFQAFIVTFKSLLLYNVIQSFRLKYSFLKKQNKTKNLMSHHVSPQL